MEQFNEVYLKYKKYIIATVVAVIFTLSGVFVYSLGYSYELMLNETVVGYADSEKIANEAISTLNEKIIVDHGEEAYIKEELTINKVRGFNDEEVEFEELSSNLESLVSVYKKSTLFVVDEEVLFAVEDETEANKIMDDLLKPYKEQAGVNVISVKFKQDIVLKEEDSLVDDILDYDSAMLFLAPEKEIKEDKQELMRLSSVTRNTDLSEEEILSFKLDIVSDIEVVVSEEIKFESKKENDSSLYVGKTSIKQKGVNGTKDVVYLETYVNGELIDKVKSKETVTKEPTTQITNVGTKEYPTKSYGTSDATIKAIIAEAWRHVGVAPYVWGGASPAGFDCSGFTYYIFKVNGVSIPRVATAQSYAGSPVSRDNLQPGDLVFFKPRSGGGVGHTGLYIGNGQMIHSPTSGSKVKVGSINSSYFASRYITARRFR